MAVGKIGPYDMKTGNWAAYIERVDMYFVANEIKAELQLATLVSVMGDEAYELLSTLASPNKPSTLKYADAVKLMEGHLQPKPSVVAERYRFRQRRQGAEESIAEYVAELKKMTRHCDFKAMLEENLRDQLVCGLRSEVIRERMFSEGKPDYKRIVELALAMEVAQKNANVVEKGAGSMEGVHKIQQDCGRCGSYGHGFGKCPYKDYICSFCSQKGHLRRKCVKKMQVGAGRSVHSDGRKIFRGSRNGNGQNVSVGNGGRAARGEVAQYSGARGRSALHKLTEDVGGGVEADTGNANVGLLVRSDSETSDLDCEPMYQMSLSEYKPVRINVFVQQVLLEMEIDTGSALSCMSKQTYYEQFRNLKLINCNLRLKFYDGSVIRPLGYLEVEVSYRKVKKKLDLYVVEQGTTTLLGRQWLSELGIKIPILSKTVECPVYVAKSSTDNNAVMDEFYSRYKEVFDGGLGCFTGGRATLRVREGASPVFCRARPLPYALKARVDAELEAMVSAGVIEEVDHSDWATPLVIVTKPDGGIRICADYKVTLNKVLHIDRYPVPKIDDLMSQLGSNNIYFSKIDLSQAYNQVLLDETAKYTVINTHRGLYMYKRLVYGLASSPGIFSRLMSQIFGDLKEVVHFLDDVLVASRSFESHIHTLNIVMARLQKYGLKVKKNKCSFFASQVKYLGFIINKDGVSVDQEKLEPILKMPAPSNVSQLRSFLGMINFYGKFIRNLSASLHPLYKLLGKDYKWHWGSEQQVAFDKVKKYLTHTQVLTHFDIEKTTILTCDASSKGIGVVLGQCEANGQEKVIAYASRALTAAEQNYSQIHKEALAIIYSVKKFHQYLYGREFVLRTDHKPLVAIFGPDKCIPSTAASRLQRWAIILSAYRFRIEYVSTDKNTADVLSRLIYSYRDVSNESEAIPEQTYLHFATAAVLLDSQQLVKETGSDPILSRVVNYLRNGWPQECEVRELRPYFNRKKELYLELGCVMWGHRVVIPSVLRERVLQELHEPHMGIVKTKGLARSYVWWPGIDEAVEHRCRSCEVCAAVGDAPSHHVPSPWPWPHRPWTRLHMDFMTPSAGNTYFIVVDSTSKWIEATKMHGTNAGAVIKTLRELWARFGIPRQVVSDNGPPFTSMEMNTFFKNNGVEHIFSAPYHPASNGAAEAAVKVCKRVVLKAIKQKLDCETALCRFLLNYRNTEHSTTGESPAKVLQGRYLRSRLDCIRPEGDTKVLKAQSKQVRDAGGVNRQFKVDDLVWFRRYGSSNKWEAGQIGQRLGTTDYKVIDSSGTEIHRHADQLKMRTQANPKSIRGSLAWGVPIGLEQSKEGTVREVEPGAREEPARAAEDTATGSPAVRVPDEGVEPLLGETTQSKERERRPPVRFGFDELM